MDSWCYRDRRNLVMWCIEWRRLLHGVLGYTITYCLLLCMTFNRIDKARSKKPVAWCCMMLFDVVWCCVMFRDVVWCCIILYDAAWCCVVLYDDVWGVMMLYDVVWSCMMLYDVIWCCMMLYDVVWCFMMFYDVVWSFVLCAMCYVEDEDDQFFLYENSFKN